MSLNQLKPSQFEAVFQTQALHGVIVGQPSSSVFSVQIPSASSAYPSQALLATSATQVPVAGLAVAVAVAAVELGVARQRSRLHS